MVNAVRENLDNLLEVLGMKNAVEVLVFALPLIIERKNALGQLLQAGDWSTASHVAHKTVSSVRMYGSTQLEALLQQVRQQEIAAISTAAFQAALGSEFSTVIHTLEDWLSEHPL